MPKMIYLGILFVLTLLVVAFAGMIREKQDRVSKSIFTLFVAVVVAVVANGIFIMTDEKAIATVSHSVFLACIDWLLLFMLRYVYFYTDNEEKQVKWMTPCYLVAGLETVSMLLNPWLHHVFIKVLRGIFLSDRLFRYFLCASGLLLWTGCLDRASVDGKDPPYGAFVPQEIYIHPGVFSGNHHM